MTVDFRQLVIKDRFSMKYPLSLHDQFDFYNNYFITQYIMDDFCFYSTHDEDFNMELNPLPCYGNLFYEEDSSNALVPEIMDFQVLSDSKSNLKPASTTKGVENLEFVLTFENNIYEVLDVAEQNINCGEPSSPTSPVYGYAKNQVQFKCKNNENEYSFRTTQASTKNFTESFQNENKINLKNKSVLGIGEKFEGTPLFALKIRNILHIKIAGFYQNKYSKSRKGANNQTRCLQKNFRKLNMTLLKKYQLTKQCCDQIKKQVENYQKCTVTTFQDTQKMFGFQVHQSKDACNTHVIDDKSDSFRLKVENIYSRPAFIREIIKVDIKFSEKLKMMKFSSKIRESVLFPQFHNNWKNQENCSQSQLLKQAYLQKAQNNQ